MHITQPRARSVSPTAAANGGAFNPSPGGGAAASGGRDPRLLYAELQFPVTSNYGSMKKKGGHRRSSGSQHTGSTAVLTSSSGEPSPPVSADDNHVLYSQDFVAVSSRKTAV